MKKSRFIIDATATPGPGPPPQGLAAFYWHFIRQTRGWYAAMFVASLAVALLDTVIPLIIGRLVALMEAVDRQAAIDAQWPVLMGMIALVLIVRPIVILTDIAIRTNALAARRHEPDPLAEPLARGAAEPRRSSRTTSRAASRTA